MATMEPRLEGAGTASAESDAVASLSGVMEALETIEKAQRLAAAGDRSAALASYGDALDIFLHERQYTMAASTARELLDRYPGVVRARGTLAVLALLEAQRELSVDALERARPDFDLYLAAVRARGQEAAAIGYLRRVARNSENPFVRDWLARRIEELGHRERTERTGSPVATPPNLGASYERGAPPAQLGQRTARNAAIADSGSDEPMAHDLVWMLGHELRNPLSAIRLNAESGQELISRGETPAQELERILSIADRMDRLVRRILDAARCGTDQGVSVEPAPVRMDRLLEETCALFQPDALAKRLTLECSTGRPCPAAWADEDRLLQVLWNLVGNAVKFTPARGRVALHAGARGATVCVTVRDTGPGIPPYDQPRIFDPFWQDRRNASLGLGLGLPISRSIVEAHGGKIWVESEVGLGTTFFFTVPAHHPPGHGPG